MKYYLETLRATLHKKLSTNAQDEHFRAKTWENFVGNFKYILKTD